MARKAQDYDDIPGTFVFDAERSRQGYGINMFCMSLMKDENRKAFRADEAQYLKRFPLTPEQAQAQSAFIANFKRALEHFTPVVTCHEIESAPFFVKCNIGGIMSLVRHTDDVSIVLQLIILWIKAPYKPIRANGINNVL